LTLPTVTGLHSVQMTANAEPRLWPGASVPFAMNWKPLFGRPVIFLTKSMIHNPFFRKDRGRVTAGFSWNSEHANGGAETPALIAFEAIGGDPAFFLMSSPIAPPHRGYPQQNSVHVYETVITASLDFDLRIDPSLRLQNLSAGCTEPKTPNALASGLERHPTAWMGLVPPHHSRWRASPRCRSCACALPRSSEPRRRNGPMWRFIPELAGGGVSGALRLLCCAASAQRQQLKVGFPLDETTRSHPALATESWKWFEFAGMADN